MLYFTAMNKCSRFILSKSQTDLWRSKIYCNNNMEFQNDVFSSMTSQTFFHENMQTGALF